jgi:hypothetical protein
MSEELFGNKKRPFDVPENYFEDFEQRLMKEIEVESTEKTDDDTVGAVISVIKPWLAMAASFLVIALLYYQVPKLFSSDAELVIAETGEESFINSLALMVDEKEINQLILAEDSDFVLPPDSVLFGTFTEEELAAITYFE